MARKENKVSANSEQILEYKNSFTVLKGKKTAVCVLEQLQNTFSVKTQK